MFVKNLWYVAGWSSHVEPRALLDRTIAGERAVFFRTADGTIRALENRCLHRSAPLSLGIHEGDGIRCNYHGVRYDAGGACVEIPGQSMIPKKACVRSYPVVERQGWIWFWPGDAALADPAKIPQIKGLGEPGWGMRTGYLPYATHYELINDNLLDLSHISYLHSASFGGGNMAWASEIPTATRLENGFYSERWMAAQPRADGTGVLYDNLNVYEFLIPGVLGIFSEFQLAGAGPRESMSTAEGYAANWTWQAITPATERSTHYFFSMALPEPVSDATLDKAMEGMLVGFEEDRIMIEAQQKLLDEDMSGRGTSSLTIAHDGPMQQMRKIIERMLEAEAA